MESVVSTTRAQNNYILCVQLSCLLSYSESYSLLSGCHHFEGTNILREETKHTDHFILSLFRIQNSFFLKHQSANQSGNMFFFTCFLFLSLYY